MPYLFTCPNCQTQTLVEDAYSGLEGRCATCNQPIQIPDFANLGPLEEPPRSRWLSNPRVRMGIAAGTGLLLVVILGTAFYEFGGNAVATLRANRLRGQDIDNLEKIASALNAYAADYGTYPLSQLDAQGQPLHSWRVLILPYVGKQELYDRIDLDLPWSAPENQELIFEMPDVFRSSATSQTSFGHETSYVVVSGPNTLFPSPTTALGPGDIVDDPTQTVLVTETERKAGTNRSWIEPDDLDIRKMQMLIGTGPETEIGGNIEGGAVVATVDGRAHFLRSTVTSQQIRALLSPAGGEPLPSDILD